MSSESMMLLLRRVGELLERLPADEAEDSLVGLVAELESRLRKEEPPRPRLPEPEKGTVICQVWYETEKEPGWGVTRRADGYSLHRNSDEWEVYRAEHWGNRDRSKEVPDIYSAPHSPPYIAEVSPAVYKQVLQQRSVRVHPGRTQANPPPKKPHEEWAHG